MDSKLIQKLNNRKEEGTLRSLSSYEGMIDFVSNDYLGLKNHHYSSVYEGSTGSRLISGNSKQIEKCERVIADFYGYESSLCFNSGYDANIGIFSSVPQKGDIVLYDEHIHASVRDGIRLSFAKSFSFLHNDTTDLERLLDKFSDQTVYVAIEGIYSMHGDVCKLEEIVSLCNRKEALIILDEAHSAGVVGRDGKGLSFSKGLDNAIHVKLVTYGKAYGGHGACVLCTKDMKSYLVNFARSLIYTTALPMESYERMSSIITDDLIEERRSQLESNISYFRKRINEDLLFSDPVSAVQIVRLEGVSKLRRLENVLSQANFAVKLVFPPTVKKGQECIRICIHSFNTTSEIDQLAKFIECI